MAPRSGDAAFDHQKQVILGPERLHIQTTKVLDAPNELCFLDCIWKAIRSDTFAQDLFNHIAPDPASSSRSHNSQEDYRQFT